MERQNRSNKQIKRMKSRKSHSWWWESHISPKSSKWFSKNLQEMDRNVRQMLKLIEEDGDSFAQKAEMYYQKRPELISLVEEFYRGYRSLAERYEHVTGELSKNMPSDIQSQASCVSDNGSDPPSTWPSPSPRKLGRRISSNRAAGFDFFLGSGGNGYDANQKDYGDGSSTLTDSDDEFDDASSMNSYSGFFGNGTDHAMNKRILELEIELREVKEKLSMHEEERVEGSSKGMIRIDNAEDVRAKINAYEEKLRLSEEEITKLKIELEKYRSMKSGNLEGGTELSSSEEDIKTLGEELRITKEKFESSEKQIASLKFDARKSCESIQQLQDQLKLAQKDIATWKTKFNSEKRESTKLQERLGRLKTSLADRDHKIRDLKAAIDAELKIFLEKVQLKSEVSRLLGEQTRLEEKIKELECHGQSLEEDIRKIHFENLEMEGEIELLKVDIKDRKNNLKDLNVSLDALKLERDNLNARVKQLEEEIDKQRIEILEGAEEKREAIRQLCFSLEHYRNGYNKLRQAFIGHKRIPVLVS
ncbi:protein NETWORKED 4A-like [Gastrolobium bilobum]|uniref:protein NETWORKED 4A-like n=1 Tax=Gastrolobium bilobum TaxID=150636 RepID=UPI002AB12229|nr:protein NETWORKED 4A-like [Gastrolobium bilobum]